MQPKGPTAKSPSAAAVDGNDIQRRIDKASKTLDRDTALTPEEVREILTVRASQLAQEYQEQTTTEETLEVLEFILGDEKYGIESLHIREVYPLRELTPLPGTPPFVLGIIHLRGQILSVIDIKKFFDLPERGLTDLDKVIIVRNSQMEFGILADSILGVRSIAMAEIQPSLPTLTGIRQEYLKGITRERMVILDAARLLADQKIIVHDEPEA